MAMTSEYGQENESLIFSQRLVPSAPMVLRSPFKPKKLNLEKYALSVKKLEEQRRPHTNLPHSTWWEQFPLYYYYSMYHLG